MQRFERLGVPSLDPVHQADIAEGETHHCLVVVIERPPDLSALAEALQGISVLPVHRLGHAGFVVGEAELEVDDQIPRVGISSERHV